MPRASRKVSRTGIYHVTTRGDGKRNIFIDDEDREKYLKLLAEKCKGRVNVLAWCLMDNHVHLLLEDCDEAISKVMQGLNTAYAKYINGKTGHVGHVFQNRFFSAEVESERYLLATVRYIHMNPEVAGMCRASEYPWSSYREYLRTGGFLARDLVLDAIGGVRHFEEFMTERTSEDVLANIVRHSEHGEVGTICRTMLPGVDPAVIEDLPPEQTESALRKLSSAGLSPYAIARLTGMTFYKVKKALAA